MRLNHQVKRPHTDSCTSSLEPQLEFLNAGFKRCVLLKQKLVVLLNTLFLSMGSIAKRCVLCGFASADVVGVLRVNRELLGLKCCSLGTMTTVTKRLAVHSDSVSS